MTERTSSEADRLARVARVLGGTHAAGVRVGIGDDAAVLDGSTDGTPLVWTIDVQVEGVHFERAWLSLEDLGYRATMAAASDLAATGASPRGVLASLVLPDDFDDDALDALTRGQALAARTLGTAVIGGNLARGRELSVTTTALGAARRPLLRSGAKPGDVVAVCGALGLATIGQTALTAGRGDDPVLADAVSRCVGVKFPYTGGNERSINPYGLLSRAGHWYVVGHDHMRDAVRSFRVDRIHGDITVTDDGFERPEGFDIEAAVATDAQMLRETGADSIARVLIDADLAASVVREFGDDCVVERRAGGAVVVEVPCGNRPAFRSWVLGLVAGAEVLSPPDARADIVDWLNAIAGTK